jgi:hypothetical protein
MCRAIGVALLLFGCGADNVPATDMSISPIDAGPSDLALGCRHDCGACAANETCFGPDAFQATCVRRCTDERDCDPGQFCMRVLQILSASTSGVCVAYQFPPLCDGPDWNCPVPAMHWVPPYCVGPNTLSDWYSVRSSGDWEICGELQKSCANGCVEDGGFAAHCL